jgi:acyl-CoA synthetase (AMP-forming)/AMP-acid ligase II
MDMGMTVGGLLARNARLWPDRVGLEDAGRAWTFATWDARVNRLANALAGSGIGRGDRVALLSHNREELVSAFLAAEKIGAVPVPMNFRLAPGEIAHILDDAGARCLVVETDLAEGAGAAAAGRPELALVEIGGRRLPGAREFEAFAAGGRDVDPGVRVAEDDVACFLYTSGTTGRPKGVVLTHAAHVALCVGCVMEYRLGRDDRALNIAPVYHVAGMQSWFLPHLTVGATNVLLRRYDPEASVRAAAEAGITSLYAVPTQVVTLLQVPGLDRYRFPALRRLVTGGAASTPANLARAAEVFTPRVYHRYGQSEASCALTLHPEEAAGRVGTVGKPTFITEVCLRPLRDAEAAWDNGTEGAAGRDCEPEEVGEILVRGPQRMRGYHGKPEETARALRGGWVHTRDLASRDAEGFYTVRGRRDDLIISGGENIYPREVEAVLHEHPGVLQAAVIGSPDQTWGEVVTAFIVRRDPRLTEEAVMAYCRQSRNLAPFKRPRIVRFVEALPSNPSGKVVVPELRRWAADGPPVAAAPGERRER